MVKEDAMTIMLTPEEIEWIAKGLRENVERMTSELCIGAGAHTQAKKIKEEMEKPCPHVGITLVEGIPKRMRYECHWCWEEAFKEVGE